MEKLTIQDIAKTLIQRNGLSKKEASAFVNAMFDIIQQSLERDRVVKVKGLGTFKIIDVDARESVNVNTGERVLIEGHDKITFTPDALMKELVNKPFSQFETVVLKDGVDFDDMTNGDMAEEPNPEDPASMPLVEFGDSININPVILGEVKKAEPEPAPEPEPTPEPAPAPTPEPQPEPVSEEPTVEEEAPVEEEIPVEEASAEETVDYDEDDETDNRKWLMPLVACLVGLLVGYLIGNYFPFTHQTSQDSATVEKAVPVPVKVAPAVAAPDTTKTEPTKKDTVKVAHPKAEPVKAEPVKAEPVKTEPKKAAPKPEPAKPAAQETVVHDKYAAMDARVRTGAYRIVGTDRVVKAKEGETLLKISRRNLGPDMECYVEVYNGLKASSRLKVGQEIKIPKLQLKKKKKPQTATE